MRNPKLISFWIFMSLSAALSLLVTVAGLLRDRHQTPASSVDVAAAAGQDLPRLFEAPAFSYPDQHHRKTTNQDLHGHVWIANFIFTQCTSICPTMTAKMVLLQRRLSDPELRFVSFSVDPDHDTPDVLRDYATHWSAHESRWLLFSTSYTALYETAAGMKLSVESSVNPDNPILHSNLFILVDKEGYVRGFYDSADDRALEQLAADSRQLAGNSTPAPQTAPMSGPQLYVALGCGVCHNQPKLAPSLVGVVGREVRLEGGKTIVADQAYLRESILDPAAKVVAGYGLLMPSYRGQLTDPQLADLITYLGALTGGDGMQNAGVTSPSNSPSSTQPVLLVTDPVCQMKVRATADTLHAEHDGTTFYFCSAACRDRFTKNPASFLADAKAGKH